VTTETISDVVQAVVQQVKVVDVHTHLFPPSHQPLYSSGIDALLTYHYLVAEFFVTARFITYQEFFSLSQTEQADLVSSVSVFRV
jgi:hypothetical protein